MIFRNNWRKLSSNTSISIVCASVKGFARILTPVLATLIMGVPGTSAKTEPPAEPTAPKGHLVIVGGALRDSNAAVIETFIELAGGPAKARIGIVPTASGQPVRNGNRFAATLQSYGVPAENITLIEIAVIDDDTTEDQDESAWQQNAHSSEWQETAATKTGFWFTGGDQTRIVAAFKNEDGTDTPVLKAIRQVFVDGGVIGGTSAGAAMQSVRMLAGGSSEGALWYGFTQAYNSMEEQEFGPVYLSHGLGFFPEGIIDQHFDRKARFGRLLFTVGADAEASRQPGFGIDEDTALIYCAKSRTGTVAGAGSVIVVDMSAAETKAAPPNWQVTNARVSMISPGDKFDFANRSLTPAKYRSPTSGREYYHIPNPRSMGALSGYASLNDLMANLVIDNRAATSASTYIWRDDGLAYRMRFSRDELSRGYWGSGDGQASAYSISHIRVDLEPIQVTVTSR